MNRRDFVKNTTLKRVVTQNADDKAYKISIEKGEILETILPAD